MAELKGLDALKQRLVDNVRGAFGDIIDEADIKKMIEEEWTSFTVGLPEIRTSFGGIERHARPAELRSMIRAEMKKRLEEKVTAWGAAWKESPECQEQASKLIVEHAHAVAKTFLQSLGQSIIQATIQAMPSSLAQAMTTCDGCGDFASKGQTCKCGRWNS